MYVRATDKSMPAEYRGIGVRIEDVVAVGKGGPEVLSASVPKEIDAVEAACAGGGGGAREPRDDAKGGEPARGTVLNPSARATRTLRAGPPRWSRQVLLPPAFNAPMLESARAHGSRRDRAKRKTAHRR